MEKQKTVSLKRFIQISYKHVKKAELPTSSAYVSYYLLLSLFPLLLTIGTLLPYLNINANEILLYLKALFPDMVYQQLYPALDQLLKKGNTSLLSFSALATLWSASKSINGMQKALDKIYGVKGRGNFVIKKIVAFFIMLLLIFSLVLMTLVLSISQTFMDWMQHKLQLNISLFTQINHLKWPILLLSLLLVMCLVYRLLPNAKIKLKEAFPGALFSSFGWFFLSQLFRLYFHYFRLEMASYQVIGSFIVLMLWLNFSAIVILIGGLINVILLEFFHGKTPEQKVKLMKRFKRKETSIF